MSPSQVAESYARWDQKRRSRYPHAQHHWYFSTISSGEPQFHHNHTIVSYMPVIVADWHRDREFGGWVQERPAN